MTASGSGLDPHVSPEFALWQVPRVAKESGIPAADLEAMVARRTEGRFLGLFGEPRVNVLLLNLDLRDRAQRRSRRDAERAAAAPRTDGIDSMTPRPVAPSPDDPLRRRRHRGSLRRSRRSPPGPGVSPAAQLALGICGFAGYIALVGPALDRRYAARPAVAPRPSGSRMRSEAGGCARQDPPDHGRIGFPGMLLAAATLVRRD